MKIQKIVTVGLTNDVKYDIMYT